MNSELDQWVRWSESRLGYLTPEGKRQFDLIIAAAREGLAGRWRPIETAPKDVRIFVWDGAAVHLAKWSNRWEDWIPLDSNFKIEPTHWTPLPDPPAKDTDNG